MFFFNFLLIFLLQLDKPKKNFVKKKRGEERIKEKRERGERRKKKEKEKEGENRGEELFCCRRYNK